MNEDDPFIVFKQWMSEAEKNEINDPNAVALATADNKGLPSVRMVLLKDYDKNGFVFYTNLNSKKSLDLKENPSASLCFHWKSLLRQIRITGKIIKVSEKEADKYFNTRSYESRIGAWASNQSSVLNKREELYKSIENFKNKYPNEKNVPRPKHWSGWNLKPDSLEFWLDGQNRIHQRLKYIRLDDKNWKKFLLNP